MVNWEDYPSNWMYISEEVKKRDSYECQKCWSTSNLVTHHKIPVGDQRCTHHTSNLITLCQSCHRKEHTKLMEMEGGGLTKSEQKLLSKIQLDRNIPEDYDLYQKKYFDDELKQKPNLELKENQEGGRRNRQNKLKKEIKSLKKESMTLNREKEHWLEKYHKNERELDIYQKKIPEINNNINKNHNQRYKYLTIRIIPTLMLFFVLMGTAFFLLPSDLGTVTVIFSLFFLLITFIIIRFVLRSNKWKSLLSNEKLLGNKIMKINKIISVSMTGHVITTKHLEDINSIMLQIDELLKEKNCEKDQIERKIQEEKIKRINLRKELIAMNSNPLIKWVESLLIKERKAYNLRHHLDSDQYDLEGVKGRTKCIIRVRKLSPDNLISDVEIRNFWELRKNRKIRATLVEYYATCYFSAKAKDFVKRTKEKLVLVDLDDLIERGVAVNI